VPRNLDDLKFEVAEEIGYIPRRAGAAGAGSPERLRAVFERAKFEVADELGIPLQHGYNGDITSREAGRIGGRLGGPLGGHMVRRMIQFAEGELARDPHALG
jgi:small acid-soluble spore protein D (minor alpha/beta-type SASP)